ncbi:carboxypeptidase-like regulatory domain-containing protein [Microbacterium sp. PAMC22086]|uniref:carboxypeptidase-like regulatory domain-containing protein n=1 Tax=Microbacterium sp. PAMC22086 TaxID=2861281 RepID=UPI001C639BAD|nr:carboxypeptidase-like regulatory domain-containing protein [Microbacterium sp. PAMC22086]QYG12594.1 carboxypeptidase-like regulatory domain-containing protein [Microbacterium sp. PAMC22086]
MARRRAFIRAVLGAAAALALALGGVTAAAAEDDPVVTGSISGTVTSTVGGTALAGIEVRAQRDSDTGWHTVVTNASGAYTFSGLAEGSYLVRFFDPGGRLRHRVLGRRQGLSGRAARRRRRRLRASWCRCRARTHSDLIDQRHCHACR